MKKDLFAHKSKSWDMNSKRVQNARAIAETIVQNIPLTPDIHLLDLGAGTGLLSYFLAQKVGSITALDNSPSMLEIFHEKRDAFQCDTDQIEADFMKHDFNTQYDGVVSSMTIHHIEDIPALFQKLHTILKPGGFIALADLEKEDGTFHSDNTGVFHYGFETDKLAETAKEAGFEDVAVHHAGTIKKPHREFGVFLLTGQRVRD
ncbi:MAG: class I SAM-dependent methyltransferase [Sulfurospirillum sp.]|nr:MAG: class I SAM-dependent methyltransferase [Sulfurospirillum sp.]